MSRREVPEAIGLSVMDLVCGLFGLLVVLFATTDRRNGQIGVADAPLRFLRAQAAAGTGVLIGLTFTRDGIVHRSWPVCLDTEDVRWSSCFNDQTEATVKSESMPEDIGVVALGKSDGSPLDPAGYSISVSTPDGDRTCTLGPANYYRAVLANC